MSQQPTRRAPQPSPDLRARVLREAAAQPAPPRGAGATRRTLVAAAFAFSAVVVFFATSRPSLAGRPLALVAVASASSAVLAAILTRGATGQWPGDRTSMLPPGSRRLSGIVVVSFVALAAVAGIAALLAGPLAALEVDTPQQHVACGALVLVQGALPLLALAWPRAGADPRAPALTGAALGAAAGAWGAMLAWLRCPHVALVHGILAHALPVLVLAAIGALVGRRLLAQR